MPKDINYLDVFQVQSLPGILLCPDPGIYRIEEVNLSFTAITEKTKQELIGQDLFSLPFYQQPGSINHLQESLAYVKSHKLPHKIPALPVQVTAGGEGRYWEVEHIPILDKQGHIDYIMQTVLDTTEKSALEQSLNQSISELKERNTFIETILQNLPIGIAVNRISDGTATVVNQKFAETYGWSEAELVDIENFFIKVYPDPVYRQQIMTRILGDIQSGIAERMQWNNIAVTTSSGSVRYVNAKNIPLFEQDLMISTVIDVTKEAEQHAEITRTRINLSSLINASNDFIWSVDTGLRLITANDAFRKFIESVTQRKLEEGCHMLIPEFGEETLEKWDAYYRKALAGEKISVDESLLDPVTQKTQYTSITLQPMYRDDDHELIGVACHSKDITAIKLNLLALQEAKEELNKIMRSSLDIICTISRDGYFKQVSDAALDIWGYQPSELIGKPFIDFVLPDDRDLTEKASESVLAGNDITNFENRYVRKDGSIVPMVWSAGWDPEYKLIFSVARDATEKKRAEQQLSSSEYLLNEAQRLAKMGSWNFDFRADRLTWSDPLYDVFGTNKETFLETHGSFIDLIVDEDKEFVLATSRHSQQTGEPFNIEYRITTPAGEERVIEEFGFSEKDEKGTIIRLFGTAQDITSRKKAEELLRKSEEKYKYLFENNPAPMMIWDFASFRIIDCNEEVLLMYGYTREEFLQLTIRDIRPAEDIPLIDAFYQNEELYGSIHKGVWRHKRKSGEIMYVNISGHLMDYNGRRAALVQVQDITQKLEAETDLIESEKKYNDLFHLSPQPMWVFDPDTLQIIQVNKAAIEQYGYPEEEFLNMTILQLRLPEEVAQLKAHLAKRLNQVTETYSGRFRHRKKSGELLDVDVYGSPIAINNKTYRVVIAIDITEKLRFESEITKAIIRTQEEERYEIGAELHDNVCQLLAASQISLGMIGETAGLTEKPWYQKTNDYIALASDEIRKLSHRLAPAFFDDMTLEQAFQKLVSDFNLTNKYEMSLRFSQAAAREIMQQELQLNLYRILQELLRNIVKHARAHSVSVTVETSNSTLLMKTSDDGIGFDTAATKNGIGLSNIKRRVELFSGRLEIDSAPGNGCRVTVAIPLPR
jgi:PAS domain S-box-containing protein